MVTPRGGEAQASGTKRNHNDVTPAKKAKQPSLPGMKCGYDEASDLQLEAFTHFWPWLRDALPGCAAIPPLARAQFVSLADYGCAEGGNSAKQFRLIQEALRKGGALEAEHGAQAMQLILNDLPINNWARCVSNFITGEGAPAAPDNYTVTLAPKSFYSALVAPPGTVHLGVSICAMVWLSSPPAGGAKGGICHLDGAHPERRGGGEETRNSFKRQADADVDTFLRLRATEFAPGGLLFVVVPSRMGDASCCRALYAPIHDAATEMAGNREIDQSLLDDLVMPSYIYEVEELEAAAMRASREWEVLQRGTASLTHLLDKFRADGDAAAYARMVVGIFRGFGEPVVRNRLGLDDATVERLFARAEKLVAAAPRSYELRNVMSAVLLKRAFARRSASLDM